MSIDLKRFTAFAFGHDNKTPEVWVNPAQIAYVEPRIVTHGSGETAAGTRIYFDVDGGVLDVREPVGHVVALLQSGRQGICKACYTLLEQAWMSMCDDCRRQHAA